MTWHLISCVSQGFVGYKRVSHQCWCMSSACPLLAEECLSCLILQMGFWNSWVDADALTRGFLTLLVSLQILFQLLGVFCVLIYWLPCIFSKTIRVDTNNSLFPTSHTDENTSHLVTEQWSLSFITQWFFSRFISQSSCDRCSVYLIFYTKVELFFFFKCDLTVAGKSSVLLATALQCAVYQGAKGHFLGLKAAACGRCFGSAQGWRCW